MNLSIWLISSRYPVSYSMGFCWENNQMNVYANVKVFSGVDVYINALKYTLNEIIR